MGPESLAALAKPLLHVQFGARASLPLAFCILLGLLTFLPCFLVKWGIWIQIIKIQIHLSHWPTSDFLLVLFMEETRILPETQASPSASLSVPRCGGHSSVLRQWDAYPSTGPLRRKAFPDFPEEASSVYSRPFCAFLSSFCSYSCWLAPWFTDPH